MTDSVLDPERLRPLFDLRSEVYVSRGGAFDVDPYPFFTRMRETGPVHENIPHVELGWKGNVVFQGLPNPDRRHFTAYDFETCTRVFKDDETFQTNIEPLPGEAPLADAAILFMNGRPHRDYRTLVQPSFVPARAMWWIENWTKTIIDRLIDAIATRESSDLNIDFCAAIPLLTITGSFGISMEEALEVRAAVTSDGQDATTLARLLLPIIAARRIEPADDLITVLVQAELTDEDDVTHTLSDIEVLSFGLLLLAAGSGTTWKQMGITLLALFSNPEIADAVRADSSFMRNVIEESVRWMPTDPVFARFVVRDTELGGVEVPAGSVMHICLAAANRDPSRWDRPDEFDPYRELKPHLGFGHGPHTCLGMHVARAEMTHGIGALLKRFPDLRLDPAAPVPRVIGLYERGPDALTVIYGAK